MASEHRKKIECANVRPTYHNKLSPADHIRNPIYSGSKRLSLSNMACTVFRLPSGVVSEILTLWMTTRDFTKLDSACCSHPIRRRYLDLVGSNLVVMKDLPTASENFVYAMQWLNMRSVSIQNMTIPNLHTFEPTVTISRKSAQRIKTLSFVKCGDVSDSILCSFVEHCSDLSAICIGSEHHTSWIADESLLILSQVTHSLKMIQLCECPFITDISLQALCASSTALEVITLMKCGRLTDVSVAAIAAHCTQVKVLAISDNFRITSEAITSLVTKCSELRELRLVHCAASPMGSLESTTPHPIMMEKLVITGIPRSSVPSFVLFLSQCTRLRSLCLHGVQGLRDEHVVTLSSVLRRLTHLSLDSFRDITCVTLEKLLAQCTALQEISLHACHVHDSALRVLGATCAASLLKCSVVWSRHITDHGLLALSDGCTQLCELALNGCANITGAAIMQVVEQSADLQSLVVPYCPRISPDVVTALRSERLTLVVDHTCISARIAKCTAV